MAEYIEREAAKGKKVYSTERHEYVIPVAELDWLPAADARENVKGEWTSPDGISICSNCGKAAPYDVEGDIIMYWPNLNFCPACGAEMKGAE